MNQSQLELSDVPDEKREKTRTSESQWIKSGASVLSKWCCEVMLNQFLSNNLLKRKPLVKRRKKFLIQIHFMLQPWTN